MDGRQTTYSNFESLFGKLHLDEMEVRGYLFWEETEGLKEEGGLYIERGGEV